MPKPKKYPYRIKKTYRLTVKTHQKLMNFFTRLQGINKANQNELMEFALMFWLNNTNKLVKAYKEHVKKRLL